MLTSSLFLFFSPPTLVEGVSTGFRATLQGEIGLDNAAHDRQWRMARGETVRGTRVLRVATGQIRRSNAEAESEGPGIA